MLFFYQGTQVQLFASSTVDHAPTYVNISLCTGNSSFVPSCITQLPRCDLLAGVRCQAPCPFGEVQLIGGRNPSEGFVEVCYRGFFGSICEFNSASAKVVCGQLGYSQFGELKKFEHLAGISTVSIFRCLSLQKRLLQHHRHYRNSSHWCPLLRE